MSTATTTIDSNADWRKIMAQGCHDVIHLQDYLKIPADELPALVAVQEEYPLLANPYYLSLIDPDDPCDPIRRMCVPSAEELDQEGFADTSGEAGNTVLPGLQHKYAETALVLSTSQCALYCRHCFRRRFVGVSRDELVRDIDQVAAYIAAHDEITNVLISGGDAFMNGNDAIRRYLEALTPIGHLRTIRFGTRTPVVLPQRITSDAGLVELLSHFTRRTQLHVVTQFNHPAEITPESRAAVSALLRAGVPVRNQTVLLRGVNDAPETLVRLMDGLVSAGVAPYYVFQCRPTVGVKNRFQVPLHEGCRLVDRARSHLNGLAKCFRFIMSHDAGKIEILGPLGDADADGRLLFKFHQARDRRNLGRLFSAPMAPDACWLSASDVTMQG